MRYAFTGVPPTDDSILWIDGMDWPRLVVFSAVSTWRARRLLRGARRAGSLRSRAGRRPLPARGLDEPVLFGSRERVSLALEHQLPVDPGFVIMHWRFV